MIGPYAGEFTRTAPVGPGEVYIMLSAGQVAVDIGTELYRRHVLGASRRINPEADGVGIADTFHIGKLEACSSVRIDSVALYTVNENDLLVGNVLYDGCSSAVLDGGHDACGSVCLIERIIVNGIRKCLSHGCGSGVGCFGRLCGSLCGRIGCGCCHIRRFFVLLAGKQCGHHAKTDKNGQ